MAALVGRYDIDRSGVGVATEIDIKNNEVYAIVRIECKDRAVFLRVPRLFDGNQYTTFVGLSRRKMLEHLQTQITNMIAVDELER